MGGGGLPLRPLKAAIDGEVGVGGVGLLQCPDYERQFAKQLGLSQHGHSAHTEEYHLTNVPEENESIRRVRKGAVYKELLSSVQVLEQKMESHRWLLYFIGMVILA